MNFEPQKFFVGLMDFFSILLPGALLTYFLMDGVGPAILGEEKYEQLAGAAGWAAFLVSSYLMGHLLFLVGAWLDDLLYDRLRRNTLNKQVIRLARRGKPLSRCARVLIWTVFGRERDLAVGRAVQVKEHMLKGLQAKNAVNAFQWSKVFLAKEHAESLATVQRFEADSKFFRSFVIVLLVLVAMWGWQRKWLLVAPGAVLILFALWRYMEQRYKATNQAYWSVITVTAQIGKVLFDKGPSPDSKLTHAGGVVYRRWWGRAKYLLVEAKNDPKQWVLPKGHIEYSERPREAAVREVHEETGVWAKICDDLGPVSYSVNGAVVTSQFFLMKFLRRGRRDDVDRKHIWVPLEEALTRVSHLETRNLLNLAAEHRQALQRGDSVPLEEVIAKVDHVGTKSVLHLAAAHREALQRAEQRRVRS